MDASARLEIRSMKGGKHRATITARSSTEEPLLNAEEGHPSPLAPQDGAIQASPETSSQAAGSAATPDEANTQRNGQMLWGTARNRLSMTRAAGAMAQGHLTQSSPRSEGADRENSFVDRLLFRFPREEISIDGLVGGEGEGGVPNRRPAPGAFAPRSDARHLWRMLFSSYLNVLLLAVPAGLIAGKMDASASLVFGFNFTALIPLALILGEITEDLALRFGDAIGGLLNATFGNVVEMILGLAALSRGLYSVVAASIIGSILSNLLLVLGCCFLFGGINFKEQDFNTTANKSACSLLFMACIAIMIPSSARVVYGHKVITHTTLTHLSHIIALLLISTYVCYLFFQLKTHRDVLSGPGPSSSSDNLEQAALVDADDKADEVVHNPSLSMSGALATLATITVIVAVCSELLTGALEEVSKTSGINQAFLGLIVLPIAGNAAEHITAVFVAVKDKMDLAIGVSLGSSIQISLFVLPVTVLAGWAMGKPFTLDFDPFAVLMLTVSVILAYFVSSDGHSNWLLGLQLVVTYVLIGLVYLLEEAPESDAGASLAAAGEAVAGVSRMLL